MAHFCRQAIELFQSPGSRWVCCCLYMRQDDTIIRDLCRQAEEAEANALAAQEGASAAVRGARQAGARLRGKDNEVGIADLHAVAAARLAGWSAWVASRNSMDESIQDDTDGEVGMYLQHC